VTHCVYQVGYALVADQAARRNDHDLLAWPSKPCPQAGAILRDIHGIWPHGERGAEANGIAEILERVSRENYHRIAAAEKVFRPLSPESAPMWNFVKRASMGAKHDRPAKAMCDPEEY
jgi:hypothetical protein